MNMEDLLLLIRAKCDEMWTSYEQETDPTEADKYLFCAEQFSSLISDLNRIDLGIPNTLIVSMGPGSDAVIRTRDGSETFYVKSRMVGYRKEYWLYLASKSEPDYMKFIKKRIQEPDDPDAFHRIVSDAYEYLNHLHL